MKSVGALESILKKTQIIEKAELHNLDDSELADCKQDNEPKHSSHVETMVVVKQHSMDSDKNSKLSLLDEQDESEEQENFEEKFKLILAEENTLFPFGEEKKLLCDKIMNRLMTYFRESTPTRDTEIQFEAETLRYLLVDSLIPDLSMLDSISTLDSQLIPPITRHRIRIQNQSSPIVVQKYKSNEFDLIELIFLLFQRNFTALGFEQQKLFHMTQVLKLVLLTLEYGLMESSKLRPFLKLFFLRTEFTNKQEDYISKHHEGFAMEVFNLLMECKSLNAKILLQIVNSVNDLWLYSNVESTSVEDLIPKQTTEFKLFGKKQANDATKVARANPMYFCDEMYSSFFSFVMFNSLFKRLSKGEMFLTCKDYLAAMHQLVLHVYNHQADAFFVGRHIFKLEYLSYYINSTPDQDHMRRADEILRLTFSIHKKLGSGEYSSSGLAYEKKESIEQDIISLFGALEVLMDLQDGTFDIRLMLTEKKMPVFIIKTFVLMQESYMGESGDEFFVQGLKVLHQMCKENYPAQAQIIKSESWPYMQKLLQGKFSLFHLLFLKQLFEEDSRLLHLNEKFTQDIIILFEQRLSSFLVNFSKSQQEMMTRMGQNPLIVLSIDGLSHLLGGTISTRPTSNTSTGTSKELVNLYIFNSLTRLLTSQVNLPPCLVRKYNLSLGKVLFEGVSKLCLPMFKDPRAYELDARYEAKLTSKNWKLDDGSFLVSLMLLQGVHVQWMLIDLSFSILSCFNAISEEGFSSTYVDKFETLVPSEPSAFDYLLNIREGVKFRCEIINFYRIFKIFPQASKVPETYTQSELSVEGEDTNCDYMPDSHVHNVPDMLIAEIIKFNQLQHAKTNFERRDLVEYLLEGICQMIYKYVNGLFWYFISIEKEYIKSILTSKMQLLLDKIKILMKTVMDDKSIHTASATTSFNPSSLLKKQVVMHKSGVSGKLGNHLLKITECIEIMFAGTKYESLLGKYQLNINHLNLGDLTKAASILQCEVSYIVSMESHEKTPGESNSDGKEKDGEDADEAKGTPEQIAYHGLLEQYEMRKKAVLKGTLPNKFYSVLQSKMEHINQQNLISYICHDLNRMQISTSSFDSLWSSNGFLNTVIFLNNIVYSCSKTRVKLYDYLDKHKSMRDHIISVIYKTLRDAFTILSYTPFTSDNWETTYAKFFVCTSFIRGLCKQNCQEFKRFLGSFKPEFKAMSLDGQESILTDLSKVLMKYLNFSGISFNKTDEEFPSDRLSTVILTEGVFRCIIDMLTGPCKQNQIKLYGMGNVVWLNVFSRVIVSLESKYYTLMNIILDYLLSLVEGNNEEILNSLSTTFDIPILYGVMTKILTLSWLGSKHTRKSLSDRAFWQMLQKTKMNSVSNKSTTGFEKLQTHQELGKFISAANIKLNNWSDLIFIYMNAEYQSEVALNCSIKIFIFLSRVAYKSKKYQIFFDLKDSDLRSQYIAAGFKQEDIHLHRAFLRGPTLVAEELIVYYFMKSITTRVEVKDANHHSEIVIFPKRPMCFFLRESTKNRFMDTCQIENIEAKLFDMFEDYDQFFVEMQNHQQFKSKHRLLGKLASDRSFMLLRMFCYLLSVVINILLMIDLEFRDFQVIYHKSKIPVNVLSAFLIGVCVLSLSIWFASSYKVAWVESYRAFKNKHPYQSAYHPFNLLTILYRIFMRKDVVNFITHTVLAILGLSFSPLAHVIYRLTLGGPSSAHS
jgi:hypothetical protein